MADDDRDLTDDPEQESEHEGLIDHVKDWLTDEPALHDGPAEDEVPFILPPPD